MTRPAPASARQLHATPHGTAGRIQTWARSHGTAAAGGVAVLGVGAFAIYRAHQNAANASTTTDPSTDLPAAAGISTGSGTGYSSLPEGVDPGSLNNQLSMLQAEITQLAAAPKPVGLNPAQPRSPLLPPASPTVTGVKGSTKQYQSTAAMTPAKTTSLWYRVVHGDTLSGIAARYHTSLSTVERLNPKITNPNYIVPGEEVRVR